jgi:hypothetical protein
MGPSLLIFVWGPQSSPETCYCFLFFYGVGVQREILISLTGPRKIVRSQFEFFY